MDYYHLTSPPAEKEKKKQKKRVYKYIQKVNGCSMVAVTDFSPKCTAQITEDIL